MSETARGLLARRARRALRVDAVRRRRRAPPAEPRRRLRREADVCRVRRPARGRCRHVAGRAGRRGVAARSPTSSSSRCGSTRSASTCTAPTARSSSSRRPTRRAATGPTRRSTTRGRRAAGCGRDDAIFGLGEKGGRHDRRGRDFTMWNTDVLNEHATAEFRAGLEHGRPAVRHGEHRVRPLLRERSPSSTTSESRCGAVGGSFVDNGYRGRLRVQPRRRVPHHLRTAGSGRSTSSPARRCRRCSSAYTWLTGRASLPPIWALGYHQCRWHAYYAGRRRGHRRPR